MSRSLRLSPLVLVLGACFVDPLLEGPQPPDARLVVALQPASVSITQGSDRELTVTVTRIGDFFGDVALSVEDVPSGATAEVGSVTTAGQVTTATVTLRVGTGTAVGTYLVKVRGRADPLPVATYSFALTVTPQPAYSLALSKPALTIAGGGVAPLRVSLTRSHFTSPVTLSLPGVQGIAADFQSNPVTGDAVTATVSVAPTLAPGTYTVALQGAAAGLADRTAPLAVTVTADALQLIMDSELSASQASTVTAEIIVNRSGFSGDVLLVAENLPVGATASFQSGGPVGVTTMTVLVGPAVPPGNYPVTLRGQAPGVPDATSEFVLHVTAARIALSLNPSLVTVFPGTSIISTLTIARTAFAGAVALTVEGVPAGVTIVVQPSSVTDETSTLTMTASAAAAAGEHIVIVRAVPDGLAPDAVQTVALGVTVRASPSGAGNVVLDWSRCLAPTWVAAQDGAGAWSRLDLVSGIAQFTVQSDRGGFAYGEGGNPVTVRYQTASELTAGPLDLCEMTLGTKEVTGTGAHIAAVEPQWSYSLGGGSGASSGASPGFTITGVREGVHDLVGFGLSARWGVYRALIRRDLDIPHGGSLGSVDLGGTEAFRRAQANFQVTFPGGLDPGGTLSATMSYLTTAACTVNFLHSLTVMWGVPEEAQRPNDFHMMTVRWGSPSGFTTATEVFHRIATRTIAFPPVVAAPTVITLPGTYKRLQATLPTIPAAYNASVTLRYDNGGIRSMSVRASAGYIALAGGRGVAMPDLSGVGGLPAPFGIPADATGTWRVTLEGTNSTGPLCAEGKRLVSSLRVGTY